MHSLQPCQLGNDSLLNMVLYPLLDMHGGASLCIPLETRGEFGLAPFIGVSGMATTVKCGRNHRNTLFRPGYLSRGIRAGNPAVSNA